MRKRIERWLEDDGVQVAIAAMVGLVAFVIGLALLGAMGKGPLA